MDAATERAKLAHVFSRLIWWFYFEEATVRVSILTLATSAHVHDVTPVSDGNLNNDRPN